MSKLDLSNPKKIRSTIAKVATDVYNGEIDAKTGNSIIFACNSALVAYKADEQQRKIEELERIISERNRG